MSDRALIDSAVELDGRPALVAFARMTSTISRAALYIAGAGLVVMSSIVLWQVILRYVLNWGNSWTELTAVLLMSWFIFLGAAVGVRENFHLGFDVLLYVLPPGSKKVLRTISDVVVLSFAFGMVYYGIVLMRLQWNEVMPSLGLSGSLRYLPLTVGGLLISLFTIERMAMRFAGLDIDPDPRDDDPAPSAARED